MSMLQHSPVVQKAEVYLKEGRSRLVSQIEREEVNWYLASPSTCLLSYFYLLARLMIWYFIAVASDVHFGTMMHIEQFCVVVLGYLLE